MENKISLVALFMSSCFLLVWNGVQQQSLSQAHKAKHLWEISSYYLYLPAVIIHKDIKNLTFRQKIIEEYGFSQEVGVPLSHKKSGHQIIQYPAGMAILYAPFFMVGHGLAVLGDYPRDGFSVPYQLAMYWGSLLVSFIGLWFCRANLLRYFEDKLVAVVLIAILFGTNYFLYTTTHPEMPHNYLFTLHSGLIAATIRWYEQPRFRTGIAIGLCISLAALVWLTEIIFALIPLLWGWSNKKEITLQLQKLIFHFRKVLFATFMGLGIGAIQIYYWKYVTDKFFINYYITNAVNWWKNDPKTIMLSYWINWWQQNPITLLAIIGFYFLWQHQRKLFWVSLICFTLQLYISSAWSIWGDYHYSDQSAMIHVYPLLVFPIAACLKAAFARPWSAILMITLVGLMIGWSRFGLG